MPPKGIISPRTKSRTESATPHGINNTSTYYNQFSLNSRVAKIRKYASRQVFTVVLKDNREDLPTCILPVVLKDNRESSQKALKRTKRTAHDVEWRRLHNIIFNMNWDRPVC